MKTNGVVIHEEEGQRSNGVGPDTHAQAEQRPKSENTITERTRKDLHGKARRNRRKAPHPKKKILPQKDDNKEKREKSK
jgi:hypothetical protein